MINRLLIFSLLYITVNLFSWNSATAAVVLQAINRGDEPTQVQLFLHFDQLPGFHLSTNGRKIELELLDTTPDPGLRPVATDERMIKMVSKAQKAKTVLSFYFRYPPQKVTTESSKETSTLLIDVLLGNQLSASYPELSTKLQGVSVVKRADSKSLNPINISPYANNWLSFFKEYESTVEIKPPPPLHLPSFPLASAIAPPVANEKWLSAEIQALAEDNKWNQACQLLREQVDTQPEEQLKERLVLTYAEALIRAGEYRDPYFLLQRIMLRYPDSLLADLANFLLIYQQASRGDYVNSFYELDGLMKKIGPTTPFTGSFALLSAELALMAGRMVDAEKVLLEPALAHNELLSPWRLLRQTDLLYLKDDKAKALTGYLELAQRSAIIDTDPMSLAFFSDSLYATKRYPEAAKRYMQLGDLLNNRPDQDLALFRLAMTLLHMPAAEKKARIDLQQIQDAFPRSKGGTRALLKQTDLDYVAKKVEPHEAQAIYGTYAVHGDSVVLREEAGLKQAIVNALSGEHATSVDQCMNLLRGFQSGLLRTETTALLIQQLPGVIRQLVKNEQYIQALVLAKQNRKFFARGWLDVNLLYDLASAYDKLGMAAQAAQTYQYLFEVSSESDREKIYLPLLRSLFSGGQYVQVEEYADRYQLRYPKGQDLSAVFLLKARALHQSGQIDKAIKLLTAANSPRLPQLELLKGRLFFATGEWQRVIDTLDQPELRPLLAGQALLLPLAESYYQAGKYEQASPLFAQLMAQVGGNEQAQFRLAQIESKMNNRKQALNLLKELAEKGKDPLWTRMAREEAAILEMR